MPVFLGLDPGKTGVAVCIRPEVTWFFRLDSRPGAVAWLQDQLIDRCKTFGDTPVIGIERVHAAPKAGVSSSFAFGQSFGWLEGMLDVIIGYNRYRRVSPVTWQTPFKLIERGRVSRMSNGKASGSSQREKKKKHRRLALKLFDGIPIKDYRGEVIDNEVAINVESCDGFLIAYYLKRYHEEANRDEVCSSGRDVRGSEDEVHAPHADW